METDFQKEDPDALRRSIKMDLELYIQQLEIALEAEDLCEAELIMETIQKAIDELRIIQAIYERDNLCPDG